MPVLPSYRNQSIDSLCKSKLTGFYIRATLTFKGLRFAEPTNLIVSSAIEMPPETFNETNKQKKSPSHWQVKFRLRQNSLSYLVSSWKDAACHTAQKMKIPIKCFFSKCDQIRSFQRIWLHLLKKFLMENFIFCRVPVDDIIKWRFRKYRGLFKIQSNV